MNELTLTPLQQQTVTAIKALRKLTATTGTRTTRTQNELLQKLNPSDLAAVAVALEQ